MVVDASVWIGAFLPIDAHHAVSRPWLGQQTRAGVDLVAPTLALPEIGGGIARRTGSTAHGERATDRMRRMPRVRLVPADADLAIDAARTAARLRLRGADAVYVELAHRFGLPLVTFDAEVDLRASGYIRVVRL